LAPCGRKGGDGTAVPGRVGPIKKERLSPRNSSPYVRGVAVSSRRRGGGAHQQLRRKKGEDLAPTVIPKEVAGQGPGGFWVIQLPRRKKRRKREEGKRSTKTVL